MGMVGSGSTEPSGMASGCVAMRRRTLVVEEATGVRNRVVERSDDEQVAEAADALASHKLTRAAHVRWCRRCGRHAASRLGVGLRNKYRGEATGVYPSRFARLRSRLRSVTALLLDD